MTKINQETLDVDIANYVMKTVRHYHQLRKDANLYKEWEAFEKAYYNDVEDFYNGMSKVRVPALHQAVERVVPKMDKTNFPSDGEFFGVKSKNPKDEVLEEQAEAFAQLIKQQFKDVQVKSKLIPIYRSLCIYGTIFIKPYWRYEEKKRYVRDADGKREAAWTTVYDNPDFYSPEIRDIFADPKDHELKGSVVERMVVDYQELRDKEIRKNENGEDIGIYRNTKLLKNMFFKQDIQQENKDAEAIAGLENHKYGEHEQKIVKYEYWGAVPKYFMTGSMQDKEDETMVDNILIEVAASGNAVNSTAVTLRIIDNPFDHQDKPYIVGRYITMKGKLYGLGLMSVNIPLQAELNTLRNQLMDLRSFILKKKWKLDRNAGVNVSQLEDINQLVIEMDDINGLAEVATSDFSASARMAEESIKQDIEDSTGASKLLGGTPEKTSLERTAAGVATVMSSGLERFELVAVQFSENCLKKLVEFFWMLDQQFLPEGREIDIVGKGLVNVEPEKIAAPDFNFTGIRDIAEKGFKINAINILLQNLTPYIELGFNPMPLLTKFIKLLGFGDIVDEIFPDKNAELEETPEGEVQLLSQGKKVKINFEDDHPAFIIAYQTLVKGSEQLNMEDPRYLEQFKELIEVADLPENVKRNLLDALAQRLMALSMVTELQRSTNNRGQSVQ